MDQADGYLNIGVNISELKSGKACKDTFMTKPQNVMKCTLKRHILVTSGVCNWILPELR